MISSNFISNNSISINSSTENDSTNSLVSCQTNGQNANISTNAGPVTFNGNTITALDWYGKKIMRKEYKRWSKAWWTGKDSGKYKGPWRRVWYN